MVPIDASSPPFDPGHHEWWPRWRMYLPLLPTIARLAVGSMGRGGPLAFTCANPGFEAGGGIAGERKSIILKGLRSSAPPGLAELILPTVPLAVGVDAAAARRAMVDHPELGGYPVMLKPDAGERGAGVRLVRTAEDFERALGPGVGAAEPLGRAAATGADAARGPTRLILQRYHPGPEECGIFWIRRPETASDPGLPPPHGAIFSITRKVFPFVEGDGVRPLGLLLESVPRYRHQRSVFAARFGEAGLGRVLAAGERVRLVQAGNHAQGCVFADGSDLATPTLAGVIDALARSYSAPGDAGPGVAGGAFDFGRFDLRYESDEALRRGERFGVVELNGVTSEATNVYDPSWTAEAALAVLRDQWRRLYDLGRRRRTRGAKPLGPTGLVRVLRASRGQGVSD